MKIEIHKATGAPVGVEDPPEPPARVLLLDDDGRTIVRVDAGSIPTALAMLVERVHEIAVQTEQLVADLGLSANTIFDCAVKGGASRKPAKGSGHDDGKIFAHFLGKKLKEVSLIPEEKEQLYPLQLSLTFSDGSYMTGSLRGPLRATQASGAYNLGPLPPEGRGFF